MPLSSLDLSSCCMNNLCRHMKHLCCLCSVMNRNETSKFICLLLCTSQGKKNLFVLLTIFECPWAVRSTMYSAAVTVHFLFKVDLVWFSLLFACFDFLIYSLRTYSWGEDPGCSWHWDAKIRRQTVLYCHRVMATMWVYSEFSHFT